MPKENAIARIGRMRSLTVRRNRPRGWVPLDKPYAVREDPSGIIDASLANRALQATAKLGRA